MTASTSRLSFGTQPLGVFGAPQPVTIANQGHGKLRIDTARVTAGHEDDFLITSDFCSGRTLAVGATCNVRLRFGPSASGARYAMLTVDGNDPAAPLQIALDGTAGELPHAPPGATGATGATGPVGRPGVVGPAGPVGPAGTAVINRAEHAQVRVYATGTGSLRRLVLDSAPRLRAGHYTLTLAGRRIPVTIR